MISFLARQPVFDRNENIFGYEIVFEKDLKRFFETASDSDSDAVGDLTGVDFWVPLLNSEKKTFVTIPDLSFLDIHKTISSIPNTVLAIQNTTGEEDDRLLDMARDLKQKGFKFSLFGWDVVFEQGGLKSICDIIQIDSHGLDDEQVDILSQVKNRGFQVLARNVESREQFSWLRECGIDFFKGDYFKTPVVREDVRLPVNQLSYFQLLKELRRPKIQFQHLEHIIERDATLTFKLLQFINSPYFGTRYKVRNIKHALSLLGEVEIQKWATLVTITLIAKDKPPELLTTALVRGKFCEELAGLTGQGNLKQECFFMGLISVLDAMLDRPMEEILHQLPISSLIAEALLGSTQNQMSLLLQSIVVYEQANWFKLSEFAHRLKISEEKMVDVYFNAIEFASKGFAF